MALLSGPLYRHAGEDVILDATPLSILTTSIAACPYLSSCICVDDQAFVVGPTRGQDIPGPSVHGHSGRRRGHPGVLDADPLRPDA
jgi:hypothetical protein